MKMNKKVLIVDDMEINRELLEEILKEGGYQSIQAQDGQQAMDLIREKEEEIAVILLDLLMPIKSGYDVLEFMEQEHYLDKIPVLIISGADAVSIEKRCFELGVSDFIRKPFDATLVMRRIDNICELYAYKDKLEEKIRKQTDLVHKQYELLRQQAEELKQHNTNIIEILGTVVESRNLESGEHIKRVKGYTEILAKQLQQDYPEYALTDQEIMIIVSASALHDIGKIAIPDNILLKPGKFTEEEFDIMKTHTIRGCDILTDIKSTWSELYGSYSYEICRSHHERYDGRGYPDGLTGEEIPISAQLVSVADVYDALVNERVYKPAFSCEKAYEMIVGGECGVFSPKLLSCLEKTKDQFEKLTRQKVELF